jgi:hypothetical protein
VNRTASAFARNHQRRKIRCVDLGGGDVGRDRLFALFTSELFAGLDADDDRLVPGRADAIERNPKLRVFEHFVHQKSNLRHELLPSKTSIGRTLSTASEHGDRHVHRYGRGL